MIKREAPSLLCETICEAVRQRLPEALGADATFFFDYEGLAPITTADPATLHTIVDRLLRSSLRSVRHSVFFRVTVLPSGPEHCSVHFRVTTAARPAGPDAPALRPGDAQGEDEDLALVRVLCRAMGGDVQVVADPVGVLAEARLQLPILQPSFALPDTDANGASAWLVGSPPFVMKMLARRLQRLGWQVRTFASMAEVELGLDMHLGEPPALVIGSAHRGIGMADMARLQARLPATSRRVLQVLQNMSLESEAAPGVEVRALPLSPRRLIHYTELARLAGCYASGTTQAGSLEATSPGLVLVVDDNLVNRTLGEEMVRMLGYRVTSVQSGEAAIERCLEEEPLIVLMDLDMPGMGGLAATRELRELQSQGRLGPFCIWEVSADGGTEVSAGAASPFDGALPKPVDIPSLKAVLLDCSMRQDPR